MYISMLKYWKAIVLVCFFGLVTVIGAVGEIIFMGRDERTPYWLEYMTYSGVMWVGFMLLTIGVLWNRLFLKSKYHWFGIFLGLIVLSAYSGGSYYKYVQYKNFLNEREMKVKKLSEKGCEHSLSYSEGVYYLTGKTMQYQDCSGSEKNLEPSELDIEIREKIEDIRESMILSRNLSVAWTVLLLSEQGH